MTEPYARINKCYAFDYDDFFLKTAKVFGKDIEPAKKHLRAAGCADMLESPHENALAFPLRHADALADTRLAVAVSYNVLERDEQGRYLREVGLELL